MFKIDWLITSTLSMVRATTLPLLLALLVLPGVGAVYSPLAHADDDSGEVMSGYASFYSDSFEGQQTANGDIFSNSKMTAAHLSLPFGSRVKVTNLRNGRSAVVTINDRGPYVENRLIDLSREAARRLGMVNHGVQRVRLEVID